MAQTDSPHNLDEVIHYDASEGRYIRLGEYVAWDLADLDRCVDEVSKGRAGLIIAPNDSYPRRVSPLGIVASVALIPEGNVLRSQIPYRTRFARLPAELVDRMLGVLEEAELLEHRELDQTERETLHASSTDELYGLGRVGSKRAALLRPLEGMKIPLSPKQVAINAKNRLDNRLHPSVNFRYRSSL